GGGASAPAFWQSVGPDACGRVPSPARDTTYRSGRTRRSDRWADLPVRRGDAGRVGAEVRFRQAVDEWQRAQVCIDGRQSTVDHLGGDERTAGPATVLVKRARPDAAAARVAGRAQHSVAAEVPEAVRDEPSFVELHASHHVGA